MSGECVRYTELENELLQESDMLRRQLTVLRETHDKARMLLMDILHTPHTVDNDWVTDRRIRDCIVDMNQTDRRVSALKGAFHRRYPHS